MRQQLTDYTHACERLFWQRQVLFACGTLVTVFFVDARLALFCYALCQLCEFYDYRVCRDATIWLKQGGAETGHLLRRLLLSSTATSLGVVVFVIAVAWAEGPTVHLGPLFFLFAAALYASMNTCQVPQILWARMLVYGAALLFIPLRDLAVVRPPLESLLWMQLGIALCVLYLLVECAKKFMSSYRNVQARLDDLRRERDRVAEAYEVQSQFVSIVSHELRTPLTSIKGSLDLITDETVCASLEELRRLAKIGQANSHRLAVLIDDLLDFQKLNAGKMVFRFARLDLSALLREAVEANRALGEPRGITLVAHGVEAPVWVHADHDRMMQVMANILSNAVKFSHRGATVEITLRRDDGRGIVAVRDRGVGIPDESKDLVFAPFTQVDVSDRRAFGGTGLGMSITRRILEGHGGSIDYESRMGEGTTFFVTLDLLDSPEGAAIPAEATMPAAPAGGAVPA